MNSVHVTRTFNLLSNTGFSKELFFYSPTCNPIGTDEEYAEYFGNQDIAIFVNKIGCPLDEKLLEDFLFKEFKTDYSNAIKDRKEVCIFKPVHIDRVLTSGYLQKNKQNYPNILQAMLKYQKSSVKGIKPASILLEGVSVYQNFHKKKHDYRIFAVSSNGKLKQYLINYKYINLLRNSKYFNWEFTAFTYKQKTYIATTSKYVTVVFKTEELS